MNVPDERALKHVAEERRRNERFLGELKVPDDARTDGKVGAMISRAGRWRSKFSLDTFAGTH